MKRLVIPVADQQEENLVAFQAALRGETVRVSVECPACGGPCPECSGTGERTCHCCARRVVCPECHGSRIVLPAHCHRCNGKKRIERVAQLHAADAWTLRALAAIPAGHVPVLTAREGEAA